MKRYNKAYFLPTFFLVNLFFLQTVAQKKVVDSVLPTPIVIEGEYKNIGFARQSPKLVTAAISSRTGAELRSAFTNNITNTLFGRIAGLGVNQGGNEPGVNNASLLIRGQNTFGFSNAPLIIVDGFLGDYTQLVPEEIEEISILKDASATAIYGMRGANGVILVTTKKGKEQPLSVSFNAQYGIQRPTNLPDFTSAYHYASLFNEALQNDGKLPLYTQNDLDKFQDGSDPYFHPNVDWYSELTRRTSPLANYNLNFSGGNKTVRYFVLLNALTTDGLYKKYGNDFDESSNATYNRYNFRANVDVTLNKTLSAQLNIGGSIDEKKNPGDLYTGANFSLMDRIAPNAFPIFNPNGSFGGNSTFSGNPLANVTSSGFSTANGTNLQSSLRMTQHLDKVTKGLSASVAISFNNYYLGVSNKRKTYQRSSIVRNVVGDTVYGNFGQSTNLVPQEFVQSQFQNNTIQASLNYNRVFGKNAITALALFNTDEFLIDKNYPNTDEANQAFPYKTNSGAGRLTYVNNNKYIVEFSGAYMGTENFAKDNRYGFFPAASIGWIASSENFLRNSKIIDFAKIRLSYGQVGNENIGGQRFAFAQRYPFTASYFLGSGNASVTSLGEGRRANPNVTWEKETKLNLGIELNLIKRVELVVDIFKNERENILASGNGTLPQFLGYNGFPDLNVGRVTNSGFELSLKYQNLQKNKLRFFAEGIVTYAKSNIVFNGEAFQPNANLYRSNHPIGQPFGLEAIGLFQTEAEIQSSAKPLGVVIVPGDIRYRDIGGPNGVPDGIIDGNDTKAIGKDNLPNWIFGLHTGITYKRFELNLFIQAITDVDQYLGGARYHAFQNNGQLNMTALTERWTPQTASSASYPRLSADNNQNNYRFSSFWQRDGSFIKLRNAELAYSLADKLTKKIHFNQARVYINGTNLLSLDKIVEGDPEALYGYPALTTVSFGIKLNY